MKRVNYLIKPASSKCNMNCKYCFYHDLASKRTIADFGLMEESTAVNIIKRAFNSIGIEEVLFAFQGGEPTLRGLEFFKTFVSNVKLLNTNNIKVNFAIQTNGTLINDEWARFFFDNKFLVGISLDGTMKINNKYRMLRDNSPVFDQVNNAIKLFEKYEVMFNVLCVVTAQTAENIEKIYDYFKKRNFRYLQFIPCLDEYNEERGLNDYSLKPNDYNKFLDTLFNLWYTDFKNGEYYEIRQFSDWLNMYLGGESSSCDMNGYCNVQYVVESDGSTYPCDFYMSDEYIIGNINTHSLQAMFESKVAQDFMLRSREVSSKCKNCNVAQYCRNGCFRHRVLKNDGYQNYYCKTYYQFLNKNLYKFADLANMIKGSSR